MSILLLGCTEQTYDMPYTNNTKVRSFQITEEKNELYASSFAKELCVNVIDLIAGPMLTQLIKSENVLNSTM